MTLPMEVQMILCHRAVGSAKDGILSKDSEAAFKSLGKTLAKEFMEAHIAKVKLMSMSEVLRSEERIKDLEAQIQELKKAARLQQQLSTHSDLRWRLR